MGWGPRFKKKERWVQAGQVRISSDGSGWVYLVWVSGELLVLCGFGLGWVQFGSTRSNSLPSLSVDKNVKMTIIININENLL